MSIAKLQKYINRPLYFNGRITRKPILVADSKGNYLKTHSDLTSEFGFNIDFQCRGGARFQDYFHWLQANLQYKVSCFGRVVLYVFLGTCDLTLRKGRFVHLRHENDTEAFSYLKFQIDRIVNFVSQFPSVKLVFLEIPPYSIQAWNNSKGHRDPNSFHSQDLVLCERISVVNDYIRLVNESTGVTSPRFKLDLLKFRKKGNKQRVTVNYSNYKDGIHPTELLARCWLKRIVAQILTDCT